ncbi:MAG: RNA polymerase sigma factor [Planctomycetota bacterium]
MTKDREEPKTPEPEELALGLTSFHVGRAKKGDEESLTWLIRRLSPILLKDAEYRLGKTLRELYDPEDLVNDIWVSTIPRLGELSSRDGRATPVLLKYLSKALLYRINNLIEKHIKGKPKRQRAAPGDTQSSDPVRQIEMDQTGLVTKLVRAEAKDVVVAALESIDEKDREIILLRGVEQRRYKEIAPLLGRDHKVLAVDYQRALEKLRKKLPGSVFDEFLDD